MRQIPTEAVKLAREVLENYTRAAIKGLCHPPLDYDKAVRLARALLATPQAEPQDEERATNTGHGHVRARPDGVKERCGGPAMCSVCAKELAQLTGHPIGTDTVMVQSQDEERAAELYSACWKMFMPGSKHSRASVEKHFLAEFAAIRAERAAGWRPISEAPKDEKPCLFLLGETIPDMPSIRVGNYIGGNECEELGYREFAKYGGWMFWNSDGDWFVLDVDEPTHWMPLPSPPQEGK